MMGFPGCILMPVISKHFWDTQFHNLGAIYLHQTANFAGLHWATNEVVRGHDTRAWTRPVHVTLPQASGYPGGGKIATFSRETHYAHLQASNPVIWVRVTSAVRLLAGLRHVPQPPKLLRKAEMTK